MTNVVVGIASFLNSWDRAPERPRQLTLRHGGQGHLNVDGTTGAPAVVFPRRHPQFLESLESGVADLVVVLIERLDCVTYSSCEGHASEDGTRLLSGRNVDILARDAEEHRRLRDDLGSRVARVRRLSDAVDLQLVEGSLETELGPMPCLELRFVPITQVPTAYFPAADAVYTDLLVDLASR